MALYTQNLPRWKKEEVDEIKRGIEEHTLVGLVDMYGIPASQVQQIRRSLRGTAKVRMARNTLIEHALNDVGGSVEALKEYTAGHSALIFTNENPFKLYKAAGEDQDEDDGEAWRDRARGYRRSKGSDQLQAWPHCG